MEKETRVSKYKELREEMKEEVAIDRSIAPTVEDDDDDFLAFLPKKEKKPRLDDTLMEPLSYETLKKDNEEVRMALNEAKLNVGKEQYNTRLDILSKIKQEETYNAPTYEESSQDTISVKEEPHKKMTLLEKLAAMSPEEDAEELKKFEEGLTVADLMSQQKKESKSKKVTEETIPVKEPIALEEHEDTEKESGLVTILNYVIVVLIVIFIIVAFFIVKQLIF